MASTESPLPLADRLRQAIADKGISQRELARRIAGPEADPKRVENERRQIGKYLAGQHAPTPERATLLAEILEKPSGYFIDPDEGRTRLIDQMRSLVTLVEGILERLPAEGEGSAADLRLLARRLQSLEAKVDAQGEATTKALKALTAGIRKIERQLTPGARPASREKTAR